VLRSSVFVLALATTLAAQATNPRFGKWRLKPTDPAETSNTVMTSEPFNGTGMKVTINTLGADGTTLTPQWGYTTMFDNKDTPMTGSRSSETAAVRLITERTAAVTDNRHREITH